MSEESPGAEYLKQKQLDRLEQAEGWKACHSSLSILTCLGGIASVFVAEGMANARARSSALFDGAAAPPETYPVSVWLISFFTLYWVVRLAVKHGSKG